MGLLNKNLFTKDELENTEIRYKELIYWFDQIATNNAERLDQLSYMEFHKQSNEQLTPEEWFEFMSDYRIANVLDKLMLMNMRSTTNRLMASEERSVAHAQKIKSALDFMGKYFDKNVQKDQVIYVYTAIPLTKSEENARNARTLVVKPKINPHNPARPGGRNKTTNDK